MENKWKFMFFGALGLWVILAGGIGFMLIKGNTTASSDGRKAVHLNPVEKDFILHEMRMLLTAVHEVNMYLAEDNFEAAAASAAKVGTAMENAVESGHPALMAKLPMDLKKLGFATHQNMDELSVLLKKRASQKEILGKISETTSKCVACHNTYRIDAVSEK